MTGKRNDSTTQPSSPPKPLTKAQGAALMAELADHESSAQAIESRTGQTDTYHHTRAAEIRAALAEVTEDEHGKLD